MKKKMKGVRKKERQESATKVKEFDSQVVRAIVPVSLCFPFMRCGSVCVYRTCITKEKDVYEGTCMCPPPNFLRSYPSAPILPRS